MLFHVIFEWLKAGEPPHYVYAIAALLLVAEDAIARSPLKANSTLQVVFQVLGLIPSVAKALLRLTGKAVVLLPVLFLLSSCATVNKAVQTVGDAIQQCGQESVQAGKSAIDAVHEGRDGWLDDVFAAVRLVKAGACIARVIEEHIRTEQIATVDAGATVTDAEIVRARISIALANAWQVSGAQP